MLDTIPTDRLVGVTVIWLAALVAFRWANDALLVAGLVLLSAVVANFLPEPWESVVNIGSAVCVIVGLMRVYHRGRVEHHASVRTPRA